MGDMMLPPEDSELCPDPTSFQLSKKPFLFPVESEWKMIRTLLVLDVTGAGGGVFDPHIFVINSVPSPSFAMTKSKAQFTLNSMSRVLKVTSIVFPLAATSVNVSSLLSG